MPGNICPNSAVFHQKGISEPSCCSTNSVLFYYHEAQNCNRWRFGFFSISSSRSHLLGIKESVHRQVLRVFLFCRKDTLVKVQHNFHSLLEPWSQKASSLWEASREPGPSMHPLHSPHDLLLSEREKAPNPVANVRLEGSLPPPPALEWPLTVLLSKAVWKGRITLQTKLHRDQRMFCISLICKLWPIPHLQHNKSGSARTCLLKASVLGKWLSWLKKNLFWELWNSSRPWRRIVASQMVSARPDAPVARMKSGVKSQVCLIKCAPREVGLHTGSLLDDRDSSLYLVFVPDVPGITDITVHLHDHCVRSAYANIEHLPNTGQVLVQVPYMALLHFSSQLSEMGMWLLDYVFKVTELAGKGQNLDRQLILNAELPMAALQCLDASRVIWGTWHPSSLS